MAKAQAYSGALRTPITLSRLRRVLDSSLENFDEAIESEYARKLGLLLRHYKIDSDLPPEQLWFALAVKLTFAHVPGFMLVKGGGRKRKWDLTEAKALVAAVDAQKRSKGTKVAIVSAMKQKDWKWDQDIGGIETRYYEAKRQIAWHNEIMTRLRSNDRLGELLLSQGTTKTRLGPIS